MLIDWVKVLRPTGHRMGHFWHQFTSLKANLEKNRKNCLQSRMAWYWPRPWARSWNFNPGWAMVMTHTPKKTSSNVSRFKRSGWKQTNRRKDVTCTVLHSLPMQLVKILQINKNMPFTTARVAWWRNGYRALDLRSTGRGFKSYSGQSSVTTLSKLFAPMYLCHQEV